jgi:hypothetical protein
MKYLCLFVALLWAATLVAADPLGRVNGTGLTLDGKVVPSTASSLVVAGDVIATSRSSATLYLSDGSRAIIEPNSQVKLKVVNGATVLRVVSGNIELTRANNSRVSVVGSSRPGGGHGHQPGSGPGDPPPGRDPDPPSRSNSCPAGNPHC